MMKNILTFAVVIISLLSTGVKDANAACFFGLNYACKITAACKKMNTQVKLRRDCDCVARALESGFFSRKDTDIFIKLMERPLDKEYHKTLTKHWGVVEASAKMGGFFGLLGPCERH